MSFIQAIGLAHAPFSHSQQEIIDFILDNFSVPEEDHSKIRRMYAQSEIETRYSVVEDFSLPKSNWRFFEKEGKTSIEKRMKTFFQLAPDLCCKAVQKILSTDDLQQITHLITVSCTGMSAPGLDVQLVQRLNLPNHIHRTAINFMGCYAGIQALKQADAFCRAFQHAKVLIVDVELCTLHFNNEYTMDNIASSLLFADGAAAVFVSNDIGKFSLNHFYSELALKGYHDMAWNLSSHGFQMNLSGYVPSIIAENIEPLLHNALSGLNINRNDVSHWAIHPGGKKIIHEIAKALSLSSEDVHYSKNILYHYGNMSSVTIFFVLEKMMADKLPAKNTIFACAFGPGLTIESLILQVC